MKRWASLVAVVMVAVLVGMILFTSQQDGRQLEVVWGKQWGTAGEDWLSEIALDGQGNIYITGTTTGNLFGQNQGARDVFVVKLDSTGQVLWSKQLGTANDEEMEWIAVDREGNVYITIVTDGDWFGQNLGGRDTVLVKLSMDGQVLWGKRLGTSEDDLARIIALDNQGHIYVAGVTCGSLFAQYQRKEHMEEEGFLAKFDFAGNLVWGKQSKDDLPEAIAVNSQDNIYVSGSAYDDANNTIVGFLAKFASDGKAIWRQVLPATVDEAEEGIASLIVDKNNNLYGAGAVWVYMDENRLVSVPDAFLVKYSGADGQRMWSKRLKSEGKGEIAEEFFDVAIDGQGYVYVVGEAEGSLFGNHLGDVDLVLAKLDAMGNMIWSKQWGSDKRESGIAIAVDGQGNIYVVGGTDGNLFGTNAGQVDIFLVKFRQ